jgi:AcrR family transcriptional regulator
MPSHKSIAPSLARQPQRERGRLRVAALLAAAAQVFAERGFDGATTTEVAARAATAIGSLYQFFPNKEALADAVLARYGELIDDGLRRIEARALAPAALADALFDLMLEFRAERAAAVILLDARTDATIRRAELRDLMRRRIGAMLAAASPRLAPHQIRAMAVVLLQTLKGVAPVVSEHEAGCAPAELRDMLRLYLAHKLGAADAPSFSAPRAPAPIRGGGSP